MPVLPFHRYIGPGNRTDNGEPVDEDDRIAKLHDIRYDKAKTEEDVRRADIEAIKEFRRNWLEGNWHSLIGDLGLSIKYCVETFTGVLYPEIPAIFVNENEECRIIVVNNFLHLHCVLKRKPFLEKYKVNPFLSESEKLKLPEIVELHSLSESKLASLLPEFLYVPLNWHEIYWRSQLHSIFYKTFTEGTNEELVRKCFSKDSLKIITKYLQWQYFLDNFFIRKKPSDKSQGTHDKTDYKIFALIHSGCAFIDIDGNLHLDRTY